MIPFNKKNNFYQQKNTSSQSLPILPILTPEEETQIEDIKGRISAKDMFSLQQKQYFRQLRELRILEECLKDLQEKISKFQK